MRIPGTESTELTQQLTLLHRCWFLPIQVELFLSARGCISAQPLHFVCCGHLPSGATATCYSGILQPFFSHGGCLSDWQYIRFYATFLTFSVSDLQFCYDIFLTVNRPKMMDDCGIYLQAWKKILDICSYMKVNLNISKIIKVLIIDQILTEPMTFCILCNENVCNIIMVSISYQLVGDQGHQYSDWVSAETCLQCLYYVYIIISGTVYK